MGRINTRHRDHLSIKCIYSGRIPNVRRETLCLPFMSQEDIIQIFIYLYKLNNHIFILHCHQQFHDPLLHHPTGLVQFLPEAKKWKKIKNRNCGLSTSQFWRWMIGHSNTAESQVTFLIYTNHTSTNHCKQNDVQIFDLCNAGAQLPPPHRSYLTLTTWPTFISKDISVFKT